MSPKKPQEKKNAGGNPGGELPHDLRSRARQRMHSNRTEIQAMTPEEAQALIYDLQLHQAELEIINEDIKDSQNKLAQSTIYAALYEDAPMPYLTLDENQTSRFRISTGFTLTCILSKKP